jgi:hypothetical protein
MLNAGETWDPPFSQGPKKRKKIDESFARIPAFRVNRAAETTDEIRGRIGDNTTNVNGPEWEVNKNRQESLMRK